MSPSQSSNIVPCNQWLQKKQRMTSAGVGRRAARGPRPLEREISVDINTGRDSRNRDGAKREPINGEQK